MASDKDTIIKVTNAAVRFNMASERIDNLKEYFVKLIKRELMFQEFMALKDINFEVKRGERIAIIGNNGTGKTTILKMINGLLTPDNGEIRLGSKVHIGYYDQEHQVLHMDKTLFDELQDTYPDMNNTQIRNVLAAFLFTGDDVFKDRKSVV